MRILAATDGSEPAMRAVELAARMAKDSSGRLKLIHVVGENDVPEEQLREYSIGEHANRAECLEAFSQEKLRVAQERASALGVRDVETASILELGAGEIAETILDTATGDETDVIVLGKRGLGRLTGLLVGSVSQKVAATATCAVIVVR